MSDSSIADENPTRYDEQLLPKTIAEENIMTFCLLIAERSFIRLSLYCQQMSKRIRCYRW